MLNTLSDGGDCFRKVSDFGVDVCQLVSWDPSQATEETADRVARLSREAGVTVLNVTPMGATHADRVRLIERVVRLVNR